MTTTPRISLPPSKLHEKITTVVTILHLARLLLHQMYKILILHAHKVCTPYNVLLHWFEFARIINNDTISQILGVLEVKLHMESALHKVLLSLQ